MIPCYGGGGGGAWKRSNKQKRNIGIVGCFKYVTYQPFKEETELI